ncbi:hypothetical protein ABE073_04800 [Lederbergia citrisecunda]|uniref:hypothetical protein n=1 Tax=Lederbergia citrisecunda TaxID=2833583 RepID=UPI003D2677E2
MSLEDIELENVERIERLLISKHGNLSAQLVRSINNIKNNLRLYEVDKASLDIVNDVMYRASITDDVKEAEANIKQLSDTFWD